MRESQREKVIRNFIHGDSESASNLMSLPLAGGRAALVGYGWAVYAIRDSDGDVIRYDGWMGYSDTTSKHMNLLDGYVDFESDKRPETSDVLTVEGGEPPL